MPSSASCWSAAAPAALRTAGVVRALAEAGIEADVIRGAIMGAVMATLLATDRPLDEWPPGSAASSGSIRRATSR